MMKLRGIQIGDYHTADDWGLIMTHKDIAPPEPKTSFVAVPGRDGDLDMTDALSGVVAYQDRSAVFGFDLTNGTYADRLELISMIAGAVHGRRLRIIDTDDYPDYYMIGRFRVTEERVQMAYSSIAIEGTCEPWRYAIVPRTKIVAPAGQQQLVQLANDGYRVVAPTIQVADAAVTLSYGGASQELQPGDYIWPELRFGHGLAAVNVSGTGTVTFSYQEAIF